MELAAQKKKGHHKGQEGVGSVVAVKLQSQLLQRKSTARSRESPASHAPRNASSMELAAQKKKGHHKGHEASGSVVAVKLQSQLLQRKSTRKSTPKSKKSRT